MGLEALLRWEHPTRGRIAPGAFIPPAERTGLIHALTDRVLDLALADITRLRAQGLEMPVSVNISAPNFLDPLFAEHLLKKVHASGLPPCAVELEFTETAVMADPDEVIRALRRLTGAGLELAIDDFGTGYSSLVYLKRMPVTTLKIDQAFMRQMLGHPVDAQIPRQHQPGAGSGPERRRGRRGGRGGRGHPGAAPRIRMRCGPGPRHRPTNAARRDARLGPCAGDRIRPMPTPSPGEPPLTATSPEACIPRILRPQTPVFGPASLAPPPVLRYSPPSFW